MIPTPLDSLSLPFLCPVLILLDSSFSLAILFLFILSYTPLISNPLFAGITTQESAGEQTLLPGSSQRLGLLRRTIAACYYNDSDGRRPSGD